MNEQQVYYMVMQYVSAARNYRQLSKSLQEVKPDCLKRLSAVKHALNRTEKTNAKYAALVCVHYFCYWRAKRWLRQHKNAAHTEFFRLSRKTKAAYVEYTALKKSFLHVKELAGTNRVVAQWLARAVEKHWPNMPVSLQVHTSIGDR